MLISFKCPGCSAQNTMSLTDNEFEGPFKCYKCHGIVKLKASGGQILSCEPVSAEEAQRIVQSAEMKAKARRIA